MLIYNIWIDHIIYADTSAVITFMNELWLLAFCPRPVNHMPVTAVITDHTNFRIFDLVFDFCHIISPELGKPYNRDLGSQANLQ